MDVLDPVRSKLITVKSKPRSRIAVESSASEARTRLEHLCTGSSVGGEFVKPLSRSKGTVEAKRIPAHNVGGSASSRLEKSIKTNRYKAAPSIRKIDTKNTNLAELEKRARSAENLADFHAYAISLFLVLVLSIWLFGYFIIR